ncbi:MAG: flagellar basal body-associated FliL family protein [Leptospiraceae bacterium]|nr:flagellar basal body-associated FliL family protein [Leptospiraceae bacterium]MDW7975430.1 flagellar basal body-associated FliL family protein [Leptospiraceae bacterium]
MGIADEEVEQAQEQIQPAQTQTGLNRIIKILIYIALGLVGIIVMSLIAYYVAKFATAQQYKEIASIAVVKPPPPLEIYNFTEDFRVNTADREELHFIRLKLSVGFQPGNKALAAELVQRTPQLRNIINLILASKTREELSTIEGQLQLREEIKASINHVLAEGKIEEVYFNEFIIN